MWVQTSDSIEKIILANKIFIEKHFFRRICLPTVQKTFLQEKYKKNSLSELQQIYINSL